MITIGVLSDTHLPSPDGAFLRRCTQTFVDCDMILHAGDLCDTSILTAFKGKEIHAVCGNMCNYTSRQALPDKKQIIVEGYTIGLTHGAGSYHNIEERVFDMFPGAHCIVYGHTHVPVCHTTGSTLFINPGSFQATGKYGDQGTYGIIRINQREIKGAIHSCNTTP